MLFRPLNNSLNDTQMCDGQMQQLFIGFIYGFVAFFLRSQRCFSNELFRKKILIHPLNNSLEYAHISFHLTER